MFRARTLLARYNPFEARRRLCDKTTKPEVGSDKIRGSSASEYDGAYKQLENLDFVTASKMLFSDPPKKKRFGFDFHMVQFFFACMPSLAIYLVALYARSEMKRMSAELEEEMKEEEKEKAKELERKKLEERERYLPEISEVKARLEKLEVTIQDIAVESKKQKASEATKQVERSKASIEHGNIRPSTPVTIDRSKQDDPRKPEESSVSNSDYGDGRSLSNSDQNDNNLSKTASGDANA